MKRMITLTLATLALAACGTAKAADQPTASTATPAKAVDSLNAAHEQCAGPSTISTYKASKNQVGRIYKGILKDLADRDGITEDEYTQLLLDEMYDADEDTLTISGAYEKDDDYGMSEGAVLYGIVWECLQTTLDIPGRVLDHVGTTRALDGQQTDSWDDINARWTYHPDHGLSIALWTD